MPSRFPDHDDARFYLSAGPLAAIALGAAFVPLRAVTTPSNLAFAFVALTIAVAEQGGRAAGLATAVCSALSLNFFLTRPYLRLEIHDPQDVVAFVGLAAVGLIAAGFGARRGEGAVGLAEARRHFEILAASADRVDAALEAVRNELGLHAAVLRDPRGYIVAASGAGYGLDPPSDAFEIDGMPDLVSREGARLHLVFEDRPVGWLDICGEARLNARARRTLVAFARLLSVRLAVLGSAR